MRKIVTICIALFFASFCYAQCDWKIENDSLAMVSRAKADVVLSKFDTISGKKILYSHLDREYYVIIQENNNYKEYVVHIDEFCNVVKLEKRNSYNNINKEIVKLKAKRFLSKQKRECLERLKSDKQAVENAFSTDLYSTDFVTYVEAKETNIYGTPISTYFVLKDENKKRYGEYRLPAMTFPNDDLLKNLYYFVRELTVPSDAHTRKRYCFQR
ncbi:MAG: hypothetical protein LBH22_09145 [Bacteroidales bacterium]|jgi:hypothetical protein|nr:hypothetical protein [Bacteroidales bacterium]